jgi:hypothetical protein
VVTVSTSPIPLPETYVTSVGLLPSNTKGSRNWQFSFDAQFQNIHHESHNLQIMYDFSKVVDVERFRIQFESSLLSGTIEYKGKLYSAKKLTVLTWNYDTYQVFFRIRFPCPIKPGHRFFLSFQIIVKDSACCCPTNCEGTTPVSPCPLPLGVGTGCCSSGDLTVCSCETQFCE